MANCKELGLEAEPNAGGNGMHASASPFEGLAEGNNGLNVPLEKDRVAIAGMTLDRKTEDIQTPSPHNFGVASAAFKNFIDSA